MQEPCRRKISYRLARVKYTKGEQITRFGLYCAFEASRKTARKLSRNLGISPGGISRIAPSYSITFAAFLPAAFSFKLWKKREREKKKREKKKEKKH